MNNNSLNFFLILFSAGAETGLFDVQNENLHTISIISDKEPYRIRMREKAVAEFFITHLL